MRDPSFHSGWQTKCFTNVKYIPLWVVITAIKDRLQRWKCYRRHRWLYRRNHCDEVAYLMFYYLYYLSDKFSPLNVFQYITFRAGGAIFTALLISIIFGPYFIKKLKMLKIEQTIRSDGPQTHFAKSGTPTMGGLAILISLVISTLLWARLDNRFIWILIFSALYLGLLGFTDDYLKLVKKHSSGLSASKKTPSSPNCSCRDLPKAWIP